MGKPIPIPVIDEIQEAAFHPPVFESIDGMTDDDTVKIEALVAAGRHTYC
jgi:hypothetical protein